MADQKSHDRVKRLRQTRRQEGFTETNIWLPESVRNAIASKVASGQFPSQRVAITHALEKEFLAKSGT